MMNEEVAQVEIPMYVKNLGHRFIGHFLNMDDDGSMQLIDGKVNLDSKRRVVLLAFIEACRQIRIQALDQGSVETALFYQLHLFIEEGIVF